MESFKLDEERRDIDKKSDDFFSTEYLPLAARLRPQCFDDLIGQSHIIAPGKLLRRAIESEKFTSIIFHGPPGTGKTSLAEIIAKTTNSAFIRLSGVSSSVKDIRREIDFAIKRRTIRNRETILFIDEIHRFNKAQQDALLPDVEHGNVRLIGATTHNPNFYIIPALVSRSLLFQLESLTESEIKGLLLKVTKNRENFSGLNIDISEEALAFWSHICEGDARRVLNALEIAVLSTANDKGTVQITLEIAEESIQKKSILYGDDGHYDTISAFIKSMRGSDADAAIYWLAKMLSAGEDIRFIARRIVIFASEDIGNADPDAISLATNVMNAVEKIGMPEARILLAQAVTYCATSPKSNASYIAIDAALDDIKNGRIEPVPKHLRDAHYKGAKQMGHGEGYIYPHDCENQVAKQEYLGVEKQYYQPVDIAFESKIKQRIAYFAKLRGERNVEK